jgi:hypothetical protein
MATRMPTAAIANSVFQHIEYFQRHIFEDNVGLRRCTVIANVTHLQPAATTHGPEAHSTPPKHFVIG